MFLFLFMSIVLLSFLLLPLHSLYIKEALLFIMLLVIWADFALISTVAMAVAMDAMFVIFGGKFEICNGNYIFGISGL